MGEQEKALLRIQRMVEMNLRAVQVAGKGIGNAPRYHRGAIGDLDVVLYPLAVVLERYHANRSKRFYYSRLRIWNDFRPFLVLVVECVVRKEFPFDSRKVLERVPRANEQDRQHLLGGRPHCADAV